jgi:hypothetical protein
MAGTVLSVGIVACAATLAVTLTAVGGAAVFSQRLAGAADAAALAAADAASGLVAGAPCERAGQIAQAADADLPPWPSRPYSAGSRRRLRRAPGRRADRSLTALAC